MGGHLSSGAAFNNYCFIPCSLMWQAEKIDDVTVWTCLTLPLSQQSFNAPPRSKMKLWKSATFAFMLCGAALLILLIKTMATVGQLKAKTQYPKAYSSSLPTSSRSTSRTSLSSSSAESAAPPRPMGGRHRRIRSADNMNSLLSECKINSSSLPSLSALR